MVFTIEFKLSAVSLASRVHGQIAYDSQVFSLDVAFSCLHIFIPTTHNQLILKFRFSTVSLHSRIHGQIAYDY